MTPSFLPQFPKARDLGTRPRQRLLSVVVCEHRGVTPEELPAYSDLILPTVRAVMKLGGSATAREVTSQVLEDLAPTDAMLAVSQPNRPESSVLMERIQWARSYAKLIGALESPKRAVFLVTPLGKELASMPEEEGQRRTLALDREFRRNRAKRPKTTPAPAPIDAEQAESDDEDEAVLRAEESGTEPERWQAVLLARLHQLSPDGFEEFVLYLLRLYGLELERVGGTGTKGSTASAPPHSARCCPPGSRSK